MSLPPGRNILSDYPNLTYIETGTYRGDSLQLALDSGSFNRYIGLEIDPEMVTFCKNRFDLFRSPRDYFKIIEGDSAQVLGTVMEPIDHPCTIFLDSHWQQIEGTEKGDNPFPLLQELEQISKHRIKTHTIIIDDLLMLTHSDVTGWSLKQITRAILEINPSYFIFRIANPIVGNMLVVHT